MLKVTVVRKTEYIIDTDDEILAEEYALADEGYEESWVSDEYIDQVESM